MIEYLSVFVSGLFLEGTAVFWTHYSERNNAIMAAIFSSIQALALVFGIGESVYNSELIPWFVLGYGSGSYFSIKLKSYLN
jgi:hypothetical protein